MVAYRKGENRRGLAFAVTEQGMTRCSNRPGMPVELRRLSCPLHHYSANGDRTTSGDGKWAVDPGICGPTRGSYSPLLSLLDHSQGVACIGTILACGRHMTTLMPNAILRWFRSLRPASGDLFVRRIVLPLIWIIAICGLVHYLVTGISLR